MPKLNLRGMLELEVLIGEFGAVDRLATSSVASSEVATSAKEDVRETRVSRCGGQSR